MIFRRCYDEFQRSRLHVVMLRVLLCCVYIVILVLVSLALLILLVFLVRGNYYNIYFL